MRAFVHQKNIRQSVLHWHTRESSARGAFVKIFSFVNIKSFWSVVIVFVLIYWCVFLFKRTLFSLEYTIQKIQYDSGSLQQFDDPYLYKAIGKYLKWENYHVVRWSKWFVLGGIQKAFPIVSDLSIEYISSNTVYVKLGFFDPEMVIKNQNVLFGVYKNYTYRIYSWNTIGSWQETMYLPLYASWLTSIDWLFYRQSAKELQEQLSMIYAAFPKAKFVAYLPGAERTIIMTADNKKVFINNLTDISQQIKSFELLKKYYTDYPKLSEIDLGSIEKDKLIVKK